MIREKQKSDIDKKIDNIKRNHLQLKSYKKDYEELIKDFQNLGDKKFYKTYIKCNYNLDELKYCKKQLIKAYNKAKKEFDYRIKEFKEKLTYKA